MPVRRPRQGARLLLACLVAGLGLLVWSRPRPAPDAGAALATATHLLPEAAMCPPGDRPVAPDPGPAVATTPPGAHTAPPNRPRSLRGARTDGALRADADGHLRVGPEVRAFFDYCLLAEGELHATELEAMVQAAVRKTNLPAVAQSEARRLWKAYQAFRQQAASCSPQLGDGDVFACLRNTRRRLFLHGEDQALFADLSAQEAQAEGALNVLHRATLSPASRRQSLQALAAQDPYSSKHAAGDSLQATQLRADVEDFLKSGDQAALADALARLNLTPEAGQQLLQAWRDAGVAAAKP